MSTRSLIAIQREEDKYEAIYCHYDGYLTYNGAMLIDHYQDKEKLEKLIQLGDISCLAENVEPDPNFPHSFDGERQVDVVVAYGRDRGEKNINSRMMNMKELKESIETDIDYVYIFDTNNNWKYLSYSQKEQLRDVEEDLEKEYKYMGIKRPKDFYGFMTDEEIQKEKKKQKNQDNEM